MQDGVILLHGIFKNKNCMKRLSNLFKEKNYQILNLDYPSTKHTIQDIADLLHPAILSFSKVNLNRIHFIGYSMGGLVIRAYLNKYSLANLGRIVMLGTPNKGSEIADFLSNNLLYKFLYGPAGAQLVTNQSHLKEIFGSVNYELGVIAGINNFSFLSNKIIGSISDGRVSVENTKIEGMKDHITVNSSHLFLPINSQVMELALNFILHGNFNLKKI